MLNPQELCSQLVSKIIVSNLEILTTLFNFLGFYREVEYFFKIHINLLKFCQLKLTKTSQEEHLKDKLCKLHFQYPE